MAYLTIPQEMTPYAVDVTVRRLCARYRCLGAVPVGSHHDGRPLWAVTLGKGPQSVLMASTSDPCDGMGAFACLRLCEEVGESICNGTQTGGWDLCRALRDRRIVWVPMMCVKQDGNGCVDCTAPAQKKQPKNRKLPVAERLCETVSFRAAVLLHGVGESICWNHGASTPPSSKWIAKVLASASGYRVCDDSQPTSCEAFQRWFVSRFQRPSFTLQPRMANTVDDYETIYEEARETLVISLLI